MFKKILYLFIIIIFFQTSVLAQQSKQVSGKQALLNYIESLKKDADLKNALWSVMVVNCSSKNTVASYQADKNLIPASIQKLITTGVGALTFKDNHQFSTLLAYDGIVDADSVLQGNLYVIGGGDPTLGSGRFATTNTDSFFTLFFNALLKKGIRTVNGKIIADISLFDDIEPHDTWEWGDMGNYYGSGTCALSFCENSFDISIKPGDSVKHKAVLGSPFPILPEAVIRNKISTSPKDSSVNALIYSSPMLAEYWLSGSIPIGKDSIVAKGTIRNPALACIQNLDIFLNNNGISTTQQFGIKTDMADITLIDTVTQWLSPNYCEIAESTNRYSNNMFAETILKNLAANNPKLRPASYSTAINVVMDKLKAKGIDTKNIRMVDGSGLSRQNFISADFMCQFLLMMYSAYSGFDKLMPAPGEKGTLTGFMSAYPKSRSKVRIKSGSMTGVLNYAGYVKNKKGNTFCVTIMTNNFTCKVSKIRPKLEKLVYLISECE
ncbi:MAG: D-alanyl-D-alanine carboxypeptidase/D-alanyl-D-alanine-endopeptidase [Prevotellaceae bacterium]|jgi:D-alanyl-D-alanine carboxypeptidase/D-alanyl-D-alanine-endopeptidase (penicillin-binding protein 4)|nr:D-alanyl-D-alanine carboxypeptidase/D-alanyl-D-alanine-endopeptidase [Prevotellaceae bacterium]